MSCGPWGRRPAAHRWPPVLRRLWTERSWPPPHYSCPGHPWPHAPAFCTALHPGRTPSRPAWCWPAPRTHPDPGELSPPPGNSPASHTAARNKSSKGVAWQRSLFNNESLNLVLFNQAFTSSAFTHAFIQSRWYCSQKHSSVFVCL